MGCGYGLHINGVANGYIRYQNNRFIRGSFELGLVRVQSGLQYLEWTGKRLA